MARCGPMWPEVARGGPRWPEVPEVARGGPWNVLEEGSRNGEKVLDDGGAGRVEPAEKEEGGRRNGAEAESCATGVMAPGRVQQCVHGSTVCRSSGRV